MRPSPPRSPLECPHLVDLKLVTHHTTLHGPSQSLSATTLLAVSINAAPADNVTEVARVLVVLSRAAHVPEHGLLQGCSGHPPF